MVHREQKIQMKSHPRHYSVAMTSKHQSAASPVNQHLPHTQYPISVWIHSTYTFCQI